MIKYNYHTHTKYCNHGNGKVEDYVLKAISLNMVDLGMTDHNPLDLDYIYSHNLYCDYLKGYMKKEDFENHYLKECEECKIKYKDKLNIYTGSECEFIPDDIQYYEKLREKVDYLILGQHFYVHDNKLINTFRETNYDNIDSYFDSSIKAMESHLFKIMAHPDLVYSRYQSKNKEKVFDDKIKALFRKLIECAIKNDVALELNCGGIRNSHAWNPNGAWLYPNKEFFELVKEYKDAKIVIGLDAHDPYYLDCSFVDDAIRFAKELNLNITEKLKIL